MLMVRQSLYVKQFNSIVINNLLRTFVYCSTYWIDSSICLFLGERENTICEHQEFYKTTEIAQRHNLKTCLYCGRDTDVEEWMSNFLSTHGRLHRLWTIVIMIS